MDTLEKNDRIQSLLKIARMGQNSNYNSQENNLIGLLDFIKYHNLTDKNMVEVGCFLGISTELFAIFCKHITSIDLWGINQDRDGGECAKESWPAIEQSARERLSKYDNAALIKDYSNNIAKITENDSLDLVYLDGDHSYEAISLDISVWYDKVKVDGILSGHDYNIPAVKKAVDETLINKNMSDFQVFKDMSWSIKK